MADKIMKKPSFFTLKRWNSEKTVQEPSIPRVELPKGVKDQDTPSPRVGNQGSPQWSRSPSQRSSKITNLEVKARELSAVGIQDLVQCSLCLEMLHNPKMLPCQHTFCMACLTVYISDQSNIGCPICATRIHVTGPNFLNNLPSNLYIDSLLHLMVKREHKNPPTPPTSPAVGLMTQNVDLFAAGVSCSQCKTVCDYSDTKSCQHCKMKFCRVCWSQHLDVLRTQLTSILKQLDQAASKLEHKVEYYKDRCERIKEQINMTADEKIEAIIETKEKVLQEASSLQKSGDLTALALKTSLAEARVASSKAMVVDNNTKDEEKVATFVNLHQNAMQILSDVSKWDADRFVFDKENFRIELDASTPLEAESDDPVPDAAKADNPLENEDSLILHYRSRNFVPHYVWRKTSRPGGVGIGPWNNHLYVCGMDTHSVLVMERTQGKIVTRLSCDEMLCPVHIAFMKSAGEIYVTDKWKHCIHVFSKDGEYVRSIGQKGSRLGMFRSPEGIATDNAKHHIYVVDTGNDRIQVIQPDGKFVDQFGVVKKPQIHTASVWETKEVFCTELNAPSSVAVTNDRVIILDGGNRRVKVYNKQDKSKIFEFGSLGQRKGQFRQPEVLAVDPMGFIIVGDSGNCRVQVFKPTGQLVRVFGGLGSAAGKFGWISGIHVTKQLDIIISDTKNHSVNFF